MKERITVFLDDDARRVINRYIKRHASINPHAEILNDSKAVVALLKTKRRD